MNAPHRKETAPHRPIVGKLCAIAMALFAFVVLRVWGVTPYTLLIAIIALGCPAVMIYGGWLSRRALVVLDEPAVHTHGVTMNYAAPVYDFYCPLLGLGAEFRRETLRHAELRPGQHVLDVGCGTGVLTRLAARIVVVPGVVRRPWMGKCRERRMRWNGPPATLAEPFACALPCAAGDKGEVVGIDPSPAMLQVARRNASAEASRARFKVAAIEALPFENGQFDVVFSSCMLHHLAPQLKHAGLAEVHRVLKPGGRFVIVDVDRPATWWVWLIVWPLLLMPMTASNLHGEIPGFLQGAGFNPVMMCGRWIKLLSFWVAIKPPAVP